MTTTAATAERLAKVRECIAGAAEELYGIDRDTLDDPGWIALIGAANDIRKAERELGRLIGDRHDGADADQAIAEARVYHRGARVL